MHKTKQKCSSRSKEILPKRLWRVGTKELSYIAGAIEGGLTGAMNQRLEDAFARKFRRRYAIGVNSGTSALHTCLGALGIGAGDEVIVPPLTFIAPAYAVVQQGAQAVFADVEPETFTIDPVSVEKRITPRTRALIVVALYGLPPNMEEIMRIARKHKLAVIEDCAQCFGGICRGRLAGTFGDMAIFSFERSKHLTTGNGGMIITDDAGLAERARKFSVLGYSTLKADAYQSKPPKDVLQSPDFSRHVMLGYNYRLPEVCAAMGLAQLERMDSFVAKRKAVAAVYAEAIKDCAWLIPQKVPTGMMHSYWTFAMRLHKPALTYGEFRDAFIRNGGDHFYAAWKLSYLEEGWGVIHRDKQCPQKYALGLCPVAESLQPVLIQLKTNYEHRAEALRQATALRKTIQEIS